MSPFTTSGSTSSELSIVVSAAVVSDVTVVVSDTVVSDAGAVVSSGASVVVTVVTAGSSVCGGYPCSDIIGSEGL